MLRCSCSLRYLDYGECTSKTVKRNFSTAKSREVRKRCHYDVLGVSDRASSTEIKSAFIKLSKTHHPDKRPLDVSAHDRYVLINDAYSVLRKPATRRVYDTEMGYSGNVTEGLYRPLTPSQFRSRGPYDRPGQSTDRATANSPGRRKSSPILDDLVHSATFHMALFCIAGPLVIIVMLLMSKLIPGNLTGVLADDFRKSCRRGLVRRWSEQRKRT